jgi:hypothetical protein
VGTLETASLAGCGSLFGGTEDDTDSEPVVVVVTDFDHATLELSESADDGPTEVVDEEGRVVGSLRDEIA